MILSIKSACDSETMIGEILCLFYITNAQNFMKLILYWQCLHPIVLRVEAMFGWRNTSMSCSQIFKDGPQGYQSCPMLIGFV